MRFIPQRYFSNLFVAISIESDECHLLAKIVKNGKVIKSYEAAFDSTNSEKLDSKIIAYIEDKASSVLDTYIISYFDSIGQGVLPTVKSSEFSNFDVDSSSVEQIKVDNSWSIYASYAQIDLEKKFYDKTGLDLLYSPFVLLNHSVSKEPACAKPTLYMYNHKDSFSIAIYLERKVLFGAFFKTSEIEGADELESGISSLEEWSETKEEQGVEDLILLEENGESEEEFHSLDDLDDLDSLEELASQSEGFVEDTETALIEELKARTSEKAIELFGRNMQMYKYLHSSLEEFYKNKNYESDFVEDIIIFDNYEMSHTVLDILKEEFLVNIKVKKVKTLELMLEIALKDLGL